MGVLRGKISEGLDFKDQKARCVIVVGIPYSNLSDPKIILKKFYLDQKLLTQGAEYNNENGKIINNISGSQWYDQQAFKAVNQAIGRVIRHIHDYGAILLFDSRYEISRNKDQISDWLQDQIQTPSSFSQSTQNLSEFYKSMESKYKVVDIALKNNLNGRKRKHKDCKHSEMNEEEESFDSKYQEKQT